MYEDDDETPTLPMWGTIDRAPVVSKIPHSTYVPARRDAALPAHLIDTQPTDIAGVWTPSAAVTETGTPVHRALATVIRAAPIMVLAAIVAVPLAWYVESGWMLGLGIVGGGMLTGYLAVLWVDLSWNSPGSTEAKRIGAAYKLKRMELRNSHELRRAIVEAYIRNMEGGDHD